MGWSAFSEPHTCSRTSLAARLPVILESLSPVVRGVLTLEHPPPEGMVVRPLVQHARHVVDVALKNYNIITAATSRPSLSLLSTLILFLSTNNLAQSLFSLKPIALSLAFFWRDCFSLAHSLI